MGPDRLVGRRFFYGWAVLAAAFSLMFVSFVVVYSFGTYFEPLSREFGADRSAISFVFSLAVFLYCGLGALTGPLADRFGPRLLSGLAALALLIGLGLASRVTELWQLYLTYSLFVGLAVAATVVPAMGTVQRWFVRRRALASGIAISSQGAGTFLGPAASHWLIAIFDWRTAYLITGLAAAVLTALAGWFLLRSPAQIGLAPDGDPVGPTPLPLRGRLSPTDRTVREAVRSSEFAGLYFAMVLTCLPFFIGFAFGITFGGFSGLCPVLMADYFGTSYVSGTIGVFYTGAAFGSLAGPSLAGVLYDRTGSYQPAILVGALAATLAAAVVLRIRDAAPAKAAFAAARQAEEARRLDPPGELPAGGSIGATTVGHEQ